MLGTKYYKQNFVKSNKNIFNIFVISKDGTFFNVVWKNIQFKEKVCLTPFGFQLFSFKYEQLLIEKYMLTTWPRKNYILCKFR